MFYHRSLVRSSLFSRVLLYWISVFLYQKIVVEYYHYFSAVWAAMGPGISPLALKSRDLSVCTLWGGRFFLREIGKFFNFFSLHREILGCLVKFLFFPYRESPYRESPYREIPYRESPIGKVPMGINPKGCLVVWGGGAQRPRLFAASEESVVKTLRPARGKIFLGVLPPQGYLTRL